MQKHIFYILLILLILSSALYAQDSSGVRMIGTITGDWELVRKVSVQGDYAYLATGRTGLRIIDVSNPANLEEVGFNDSLGWVAEVKTLGNIAYVLDYNGFLRLVDVSDPSHPYERSNYEFLDTPRNMFVTNTFAYIAASSAGFYIIDISDPDDPQEVGFFDIDEYWSSSEVHNVIIYENYALLYIYRGTGERLLTIDISDHSELMILDDDHFGARSGLVNAYTVNDQGMVLFAVSNNEKGLKYLELGHSSVYLFELPDNAMDITTVGDYSYMAVWNAGLWVIRSYICMWPVVDPFPVGYYDTPGSARGVEFYDGLVYVADMTNLGIYDCSEALSAEEPDEPQPVTYELFTAYPNPFNSTTTITYGLNKSAPTRLTLYDLSGREVTTLFDGYRQAGFYSVYLNADDLSSGLYFLRLEASGRIQSQKIMLIK